MRYFARTVVIFSVMLAMGSLSAAPHADQHWYQITITTGQGTETITGSSPSDSNELARAIAGTNAIVLENIKDQGIFEQGKPISWRAAPGVTKIFIIPRSILYFVELSGDPLERTHPH